MTAVDLDTGNNARLSYRLQGSTAFRISPNTGWIYLAQALDRESSDRHALTVLATDNGSPAATASTSVLVTVLDDNDNDPRFEKEFYGFELLENLPSGTLVGSVSASDPDLGKNALLRYAVVQANSSFTVDPDTGKTTTPLPLYIYIYIYTRVFTKPRPTTPTPNRSSHARGKKNICESSPPLLREIHLDGQYRTLATPDWRGFASQRRGGIDRFSKQSLSLRFSARPRTWNIGSDPF